MKNSPLSFSVNLKIDKSQSISSQFDYWILFSIIFLCSFGLAMIYSSSNSLEMTIRQGAYFFLGLIGMLLLAFSNFRKMEVFWGLVLSSVMHRAFVGPLSSAGRTERPDLINRNHYKRNRAERCGVLLTKAHHLNRDGALLLPGRQ